MDFLLNTYHLVAEFTGPIFGYGFATLFMVGAPIGFVISKIFPNG